jgi:hypothetical protein
MLTLCPENFVRMNCDNAITVVNPVHGKSKPEEYLNKLQIRMGDKHAWLWINQVQIQQIQEHLRSDDEMQLAKPWPLSTLRSQPGIVN